MSTEPVDLPARLRAFLAERTAIPTVDIEALLRAQEEFWAERYPEELAAAIRLVMDAESS